MEKEGQNPSYQLSPKGACLPPEASPEDIFAEHFGGQCYQAGTQFPYHTLQSSLEGQSWQWPIPQSIIFFRKRDRCEGHVLTRRVEPVVRGVALAWPALTPLPLSGPFWNTQSARCQGLSVLRARVAATLQIDEAAQGALSRHSRPAACQLPHHAPRGGFLGGSPGHAGRPEVGARNPRQSMSGVRLNRSMGTGCLLHTRYVTHSRVHLLPHLPAPLTRLLRQRSAPQVSCRKKRHTAFLQTS